MEEKQQQSASNQPESTRENPSVGSTISPQPVSDTGLQADVPSPSQAAGAPPAATDNKPPKKNLKWALVALLVLLLGAALAGGWWYFLREESPASTTKTTVKKDIAKIAVALDDTDPAVLYPDDDIGTFDVAQQALEGLVGYDDNQLVPRLAEKWINPDESTWDITLKKGVKFHTGREMKATDIKPSVDLVRDAEFYSTMVNTISDVQVLDDYKVRIKTSIPDALLLRKLSYVYIIDSTSDKTYIVEKGTGPYTLKEGTKPENESIQLVAFDEYHGGRPYTRELSFKLYEEGYEAILEEAKKGNVDAFSNRPVKEAVTLFKNIGFQYSRYESAGSWGLHLNAERVGGPFTNEDLRKAVSLAIDRQKIIDEADFDLSPLSQTLPINTTGYVSSIKEVSQDVDAAKALLKKAGYTNQPIKVVYSSEVQFDMPELLKELEAAGFKLELKDVSTSEIFSLWKTGAYDIVGLSYYSDFNDGSDVLRSVIDKDTNVYASYSSPELLKKLQDADSEFDNKKRVETLQEINQALYDESAWTPVRTLGRSNFLKPGIVAKTDFTNAGLGIYFWKVYAE